jgi:peptidoglycan/LPS O-acetylase OafA/YrhL
MQISPKSIQPTAHQSAHSRLLGLEMVRAIAIIAVLFYHLNLNNFFNAGFLGVDIFFTLSGFLITSLLLREYSQVGYIDIFNFYFRRFKRLYPACVAMMLGCAVFSMFLNQETAERFHKDLPAAIFYLSNWWQIYSDQSYFENFGNPPLLQHLWSLALEEQFYIFWPLILIILLKWLNKKAIGIVCLGVAITSTYWMWIVHQSHLDLNDPSRSYLGTDTHAMGLFLGAALSCFWNPWEPRSTVLTFRQKNFSFAIACLALTLLLIMITFWHEGLSLLFYGGFFLTCLCTLVLIIS